MKDRTIVIIGAGVAGLAAGCYAQMNGYQTRIVEMHTQPGGVCTSWRRGDYRFDGCIQWLMGTRPGSSFNRIWRELGALLDTEIVDHDEFLRVEGRGGRALVVYTDMDRFEAHLRELAPADAALSHRFCEVVRRCAVLDRDVPRSGQPLDRIARWVGVGAGLLPVAPSLLAWRNLTWQELAARFTDRFVRDAFRSIFDVPDFPLLAGVFTLAWMHARDAGYPIGGSLPFAQAIERRYRDLGGEIDYGVRVETIVVQDDRAVGVRLANGAELRADDVISAADGHATIFELLGGHYLDPSIRRAYDELPIFRPLVQVSLGVRRDLSGMPHALTFPLATPASIAGEVRESLTVRHYAYDPTLAPAGHAVMSVLLETDYDWWAGLVRQRDRYDAEKQRVGEAVIAALADRLPGLAADVEVVDVATPMTWERITGNWRGAYEGWLPTRRTVAMSLRGGMPNTLRGLDRCFMTGQWVVPGGGLPGVAPAARTLVKQLCRRDRRSFETIVMDRLPTRLRVGEPDGSELAGAGDPAPTPTPAGAAGGLVT